MDLTNQNSNVLVSFIITCCNPNTDELIHNIDQILKLSLNENEREIIIIDDGSTHCILNQLMPYADNITYLRIRKSGLSIARNRGISISTGKYLQFLRAEDTLITEPYEHCLDIVRYNHPDMVLFNTTDKDKKMQVFYMPDAEDGAHYMRHNTLQTSACGYIFNKDLLLNLRFTPGLTNEDEEFTPLLLLRADNIYSTDLTAYKYGQLPDKHTCMDRRSMVKYLDDTEAILFHLNSKADAMTVADRLALRRRVAELTMEYIFDIIRFTHSSKQLETRISSLQKQGLFPLPDYNYTKKYTLMRKIIKNKIMRRLVTFAYR